MFFDLLAETSFHIFAILFYSIIGVFIFRFVTFYFITGLTFPEHIVEKAVEEDVKFYKEYGLRPILIDILAFHTRGAFYLFIGSYSIVSLIMLSNKTLFYSEDLHEISDLICFKRHIRATRMYILFTRSRKLWILMYSNIWALCFFLTNIFSEKKERKIKMEILKTDYKIIYDAFKISDKDVYNFFNFVKTL